MRKARWRLELADIARYVAHYHVYSASRLAGFLFDTAVIRTNVFNRA